MNDKVNVGMEGGKALMKLQMLCQSLGWDFDKIIVQIINEFLANNEMKIQIESKIADYRRKR
jgi:hypothetical protein